LIIIIIIIIIFRKVILGSAQDKKIIKDKN
jgi:hypothetical protein